MGVMNVGRVHQAQEQSKALDHESKPHHGQARAGPRQQRAFRCEKYPRIIGIGHEFPRVPLEVSVGYVATTSRIRR